MSDDMADFFRCAEQEGTWLFEVAVVRWDGPHTPLLEWVPFRRWRSPPDDDRLRRARDAALNRTRFFRRCHSCEKLQNVGHMHDKKLCQGCAERELGIVH